MPPVRSRNGVHIADALGTPCSHSTGGSPPGALRQATGDPSSSAAWSRTDRTVASAAMSRQPTAPRRMAAAVARAASERCATGCGDLRPAMAPPHGERGRRAGPHGPVAVHQRPQPRRRVPAPARALPESWEAVRDAPVRGDRGGDPARRAARAEVRAHPGDPARAVRRPRPVRLATASGRRGRARADRAPRRRAARRPPASCSSPSACATCPVDTHVSRVGTRLRLLRPGAPFAELHDDDARG